LGIPAEKLSRLASSPNLARWWKNFLASFQNPGDLGSLHPEITLSAPVGNHRLVAKYDLITNRDGRLIIHDWKTYHQRPRNEWLAVRLQTRVYRYLLAAAGKSLNGGESISPDGIDMIYWFTDYPNEPTTFTYDHAQFLRDTSAIEKLIQEIQSRDKFELTEDERKCNYCPYRSYCKRGTLAGNWQEADVEAEPVESPDINLEQIAEIAF